MDELSYIAGIMDSGCSVVIEKSGRPKIDIMRKNPQVLELIKKHFGGGLVRWSSRGGWRLRIRNYNAYIMAREMHGRCVARKHELQLLLDLSLIAGQRGKGEAREKIRKQLMESRKL